MLLGLMQASYPHVHAIGTARDWEGLPYIETAAARGVLSMEVDILRRMPFAAGSFDVVHAKWSGMRYLSGDTVSPDLDVGLRKVRARVHCCMPPRLIASPCDGVVHGIGVRQVRAQLYEYHRLTRPGGYIVHWPWLIGSRSMQRTAAYIQELNRTTRLLGWETIALEFPPLRARCTNPASLQKGDDRTSKFAVYFAFRKPIGWCAPLPPPAPADAWHHLCFGLNVSRPRSVAAEAAARWSASREQRCGGSPSSGANGSVGPVIIVGMSHSGTSIMQREVSRHPAIYALGSGKGDQESYLWAKNAGNSTHVRYMLSTWAAACVAAGKTTWVEKTPKHLVFVPRIREDLPHAKLLIMVRDPRDVMISLTERMKAKPNASDILTQV